MTYVGEEFQKRYKALPEDIQNVLTAMASVDTIFAIGKKHGLMIDQIGKMADEIWKVMLGLADPKDFIRNLASALGIESEKASAIASDVNTQMFQLIRESLRKLYDQIPLATSKEEAQPLSSLRPREAGEAIPQSKDRIANLVPSAAMDLTPRNDGIPSMIYPQAKFEEPFEKEPEMFDTKSRAKEAPKQLAPLVSSVVEGPPPPPPPPGEEDFTYPEKTKEVSREPAAGNYKGRDPYRESTEE